jgi:hypothetical protein
MDAMRTPPRRRSCSFRNKSLIFNKTLRHFSVNHSDVRKKGQPMSPGDVDAILRFYEVTLCLGNNALAGGAPQWQSLSPNGSMGLSGSNEAQARSIAALMYWLWGKGVDIGFARDLACAYNQVHWPRSANEDH